MNPDRDRILEQALTHELKAGATAPAGACLDAETLGAWSDGGLDPAAAAACEAHVSSCARCQSMVGVMTRGGAHAADATVGTIESSRPFSLWRWWLAPIAAGAAAVTLWMVVPEQQQVAVAPVQQQQPTGTPSEIPRAPQPQAEQPPAARPQVLDQLERDSAAAQRADQAQGRRQESFSDQKPQAARKEELAVAEVRERAAAADAAVPPPAAAAPPPPPPASSVGAVAQAPSVAAETLQKSARAGVSQLGFEIPTLRPGVRWRITGDDFVEVTENNGTSWQRKHQLPGVNTGSAPGAGVLWLGGDNGAVWLTTDSGATFRSIGLGEPLDIASLSATDAQTASVFTVSGRRFRTEDGGRTWRPF